MMHVTQIHVSMVEVVSKTCWKTMFAYVRTDTLDNIVKRLNWSAQQTIVITMEPVCLIQTLMVQDQVLSRYLHAPVSKTLTDLGVKLISIHVCQIPVRMGPLALTIPINCAYVSRDMLVKLVSLKLIIVVKLLA